MTDHLTEADSILRSVWPEWKIVDIIGAGTYGDVYEISKGDNIRAALKITALNSGEAAAKAGTAQFEQMRREYAELSDLFRNEMTLMEKVRHSPNIVSMEDYAVIPDENGVGFHILIRMELLNPMRELVPMDEEKTVRLGIDICGALEVCRKEKIIHRDIKPGNIMYSDYGGFKLGDFGIARVMDVTSGTLTRKTGTPLYMAPEVATGKAYDYRSDIYSLGMVMYVCLNGQKFPFIPLTKQIVGIEEREDAYRRRMAGEPLPPPAHASPELAKIILRACEADPKDRYADASRMRADLLALGENKADAKSPVGKRLRLRAAGFAAAFLLIGAAAGAGAYRIISPGKTEPLPAETEDAGVNISVGGHGDMSDIVSVSILSPPKRTDYSVGDTLDTDGLALKVECRDGTGYNTPLDENLPDIRLSDAGTLPVTVNYHGFEVGFDVKVSTPLTFELSDDWSRCAVTGTNDPDAEKLIIPAYYQGIPVREISGGAFAECSAREVFIPDTVEIIGCGSFYRCGLLEKIDIPASVKEIRVGEMTNVNGHDLWRPFDSCESLTEVTVDPSNPVYHSSGNCVIETGTKRLILGVGSPVIPDDGSVETLGKACFQDLGLKDITIPEGITDIESHAFWKNDIRRLRLPSTVRNVEPLAFCYAGEELESIEVAGDGTGEIYAVGNCLIRRSGSELILGCRNSVIPDDGQVLVLGPSCMERRGIESMILPNCITASSSFTLSENYGLKTAVLPRSMPELNSWFFNGCAHLESVVIPDTVKWIGKGAFSDCRRLKTIYFEGTREQWETVTISEDHNEYLLRAEVVYDYKR